jgi:predicted nucleotidyltransferase component of viral defense system
MLQTRTIEPRTLELLKVLMDLSILKRFHLVGGTALALQLGHRFSVDLDLFTTEQFESAPILRFLENNFDVSILLEETNMCMLTVDEVKVDFVKMSYPILFPTVEYDGVRMLGMEDIAAMKLKAVTQRGSKKDFYDLYYLLQLFPLKTMLDNFRKKFKQHEVFHVIKSLGYFDDAESNPDPVIFDQNLNWDEVKKRMRRELNNI